MASYSGAAAASSGGGGPVWVATLRTRASSLSGGVLGLGASSEWYTDFADTGSVALTTVTGTATMTLSTTLDGGVVALATDTTPACVGVLSPAGKPSLISNPQAKKIYVMWTARFVGPIDASTYLRLGISNPAALTGGGSGRWAYLGCLGGTSTTKYSIERFDGSSNPTAATSTNIDTTGFHTIEFYSDGTTGTFYYDGVAINLTIDMTTVGTVGMTCMAQVVNTAGAVRTIQLDKMYASFLAQ